MSYIIIVVCMVCKRFIATKDTTIADHHGELSHGYCKACYDKIMEEFDEGYDHHCRLTAFVGLLVYVLCRIAILT